MSRETILAALQAKVQKGEPIIVTAAGAGLIARLEEKSGAEGESLGGLVDPLLAGTLMVTVGLTLLSVMLPLIGMMNSIA